jgi:crotonobetainyl-CoA:carnitine CoA-transferase CaiB-like acyl-CoA transferase
VATAYTAVEIAADAHFAARHDLVTVDDPVLGDIKQQAPYPRLVGETGTIPAGAPTLGADNVEVWCDMAGLTPGELDALQTQGIV